MLLITGTQRTGSTVLLEFLEQVGYETSVEMKWDEDVNGGKENLYLGNFYKHYLGDRDFPFKGFPNHMPSINRLDYAEVTKFSYLLMNPVFVSIYYKKRGNKDKILVLDRDKEEVYNSKLNHNSQFSKDSFLLQQSPIELKYNFQKSLESLDKLGFNYEIVKSPEFLKDFNYLSEKLKELGFNIDGKEELFNKIVDTDKLSS